MTVGCPSCGAALPSATPQGCAACGVPLAGDAGRRLLVLDHHIPRLLAERRRLLEQVRAERDRWAQRSTPPPAVVAAAGERAVSAPPAYGAGAGVPAAAWLRGAGPQALLAAGGVLLLVVAALVFTAVAWPDLPILARGGLLLLASAACAAGTQRLVTRGLQRTAEATAVLTVLLLTVLISGLWRAGVLDAQGGTVLACSAGALAAVSHGLARGTRTRSPHVLAAWLAPLSTVAAGARLAEAFGPVAGVDLDLLLVSAALLGAAVVGAALAQRHLTGLRGWRVLTQVAAALLWSVATAMVVGLLATTDLAVPAGPVAFVAQVGLAAAAAGAAWWARVLGDRGSWWRPCGVAGAWLAGTAAAAAALHLPETAWQPLRFLLPAGLGVAALARLAAGRARVAAAVGMLPILYLAAVPWLRALGWLLDSGAARTEAPWAQAGASVPPPAMPVLVLAALAVAVGSVAAELLWRRPVAVSVAASGAAVVAVATGLLLWPGGAGAGVALAIAAAGAWALRRAVRWEGPLAALVGGTALGVALGLSGELATVLVLAGAIAVTAPPVVAAMGAQRAGTGEHGAGARPTATGGHGAPPWSAVVLTLLTADVLGLVVAVVAASTRAPGPVGLSLAVASAVVWVLTVRLAGGVGGVGGAGAARGAGGAGAALPLAAGPAGLRALVAAVDDALAVEVTAAVGFAAAIGIAAPAGAAPAGAAVWLALTLAVLAVAATAVAVLRSDRRWMRWVATAAASTSSWTLLADRGVDIVEAYTVPPALLILALGTSTLRRRDASSWQALGAGLGLLLTPTVLSVLDDPDDLGRVLAAIVVGCALAVAGRVWRLQAPLVSGVAAAAVVALTQHDVVTAVLPRWVLLAAAGALLLWLSISYERQLQRLTVLRAGLAELR